MVLGGGLGGQAARESRLRLPVQKAHLLRKRTLLENLIENHAAAVALGYFAYNFIKIHRTLRMTPAMAAGVTDRPWEVSDLVALWEAEETGLERAA